MNFGGVKNLGLPLLFAEFVKRTLRHERILDLENLGINHCFSTRIKSIQYFNLMAAWSFQRWSQLIRWLLREGFNRGINLLKVDGGLDSL